MIRVQLPFFDSLPFLADQFRAERLRVTFKRRSSQAFPSRVDTILKSAGQHRLAPKPPPFAASVWLDAVGPLIANRSEPLSLQRGELLVRVNSSVWASELSMHSSVVIARLVERRKERDA